MKPTINITSRSQLIEAFLYMNGRHFSLGQTPSWRPIYNDTSRELLMLASRQVGKTTAIVNFMATDVLLKDFYAQRARAVSGEWLGGYLDFRRILLVTPSDTQTKTISTDRLNVLLKEKPEEDLYEAGYRNYFTEKLLDTQSTDKVSEKRFKNNITIFLRSSYLTADRIRGLSADRIFYDEFQDLIPDNVEVINKCSARSEYKLKVFSGTPKSTMNPIQKKWEESTQVEWFAKCYSCGKNDIYIDERILSKEGPRCTHCKELFDPSQGQWVRTGPQDAPVSGYRITQFQFLNCPWVEWDDIWRSYQNNAKAIFFNEDLGLSYDGSSAAMSLPVIKANCANYKFKFEDITFEDVSRASKNFKSTQLFVGIDWGSEEGSSATVLTIGCWGQGIFHILWIGRLKVDPVTELKIIKNFLSKISFNMLIADAGFGVYQNQDLKKHFGNNKVFVMQHSDFGSASTRDIMRFNQKLQGGGFITDRTKIMTTVMKCIEHKKVQLPNISAFAEFQDDFLSIRAEYDEKRNKLKYVHSKPDDAFHSLLYCYVAGLKNTNQQFPIH